MYRRGEGAARSPLVNLSEISPTTPSTHYPPPLTNSDSAACVHSYFSLAEPTKQNIMKDANCKPPKTGGPPEAGVGIAKVPALGVGVGICGGRAKRNVNTKSCALIKEL